MTKSATSSRRQIRPERRAYLRLLSQIHLALDNALAEERERHGTTISTLATALGVNKSVLSRKLRGERNLTLESLAKLAWALNRDPRFSLVELGDGAARPSNSSVGIRFGTAGRETQAAGSGSVAGLVLET